MACDTVYRDGNCSQAIRNVRWELVSDVTTYWDVRPELMAADTIYIDGTDDRRFEIQRSDLKVGDTIDRDGNWWQAMRYIELWNNGIRNVIQKAEPFSSDTIYVDWNNWHAIRYTEMKLEASDTIFRDGKSREAIRTLRWKLMTGDAIYRDGNLWQAMRYTEMGTDGSQ